MVCVCVGVYVCMCCASGRLIRADKYDLTNFRPHKYSEKTLEESAEIGAGVKKVNQIPGGTEGEREREIEKIAVVEQH